MLELLTDPHAWVALLTLTLLEIVLGIDNVIFISVLAQRLPAAQRQRAARLGLALALLTRVALLGMLFWLSGLTATLFSVLGHAVSARDLILFGGGLFLMAKATTEIHATLEEAGEREAPTHEGQSRFWSVVAQIGLIDVVFSLDSVITAVGIWSPSCHQGSGTMSRKRGSSSCMLSLKLDTCVTCAAWPPA